MAAGTNYYDGVHHRHGDDENDTDDDDDDDDDATLDQVYSVQDRNKDENGTDEDANIDHIYSVKKLQKMYRNEEDLYVTSDIPEGDNYDDGDGDGEAEVVYENLERAKRDWGKSEKKFDNRKDGVNIKSKGQDNEAEDDDDEEASLDDLFSGFLGFMNRVAFNVCPQVS